MKSKKWLLALLFGACALTASACDDDSGESIDVIDNLSYSLKCASSTTCMLELEPNQTGLVTVQLSAIDDQGNTSLIAGVPMSASTQSPFISIVPDSNPQVTDPIGQYTVNIKAGATDGIATLVISADPAYPTVPVTFVVNVKTPQVILPEPARTDYTIRANYNGTQKLDFAEVMLFEGKNCNELVTTGMTSDELKMITAPDRTLIQAQSISTQIEDLTFNISREEEDFTSYAALGIAQSKGVMVAYGCTDGLSRNVPSTVIAMGDAQILEPPVIDPPIITPPDIVEPGVLDYKGTYELTSSFNALSLLPHAETDRDFVMFKDMLVGDWIEFALDLLSDPEGTVPQLLTEQLLPLLLDAQWFHDLIGKLVGEEFAALLTPETINALFSQFGLDKLITDTIRELTSQISWWNTATGSVEIVNNLATNFTLHGNFTNKAASEPDENGVISGIGHNYQRLLYHNGGVPINGKDCIIGKPFEETKNGATICAIDLTNIEGGGVIRGAFSAQFNEFDENTNAPKSVVINRHALDLAYGSLIYGILMDILPAALGNENLDSLGGVLEYYIGMGLVALWNKDNEDKITDLSSCAAIGEVASRYLKQLMGNNNMGTIIANFANGATLGSLCTKGINAFNGLIDTQLDRLSVSTDKVMFSSENCELSYTIDENGYPVAIAEFGKELPWDSNAKDNRCVWNVSIDAGTDDEGNTKTMSIKGHFHAVGDK